MKLNFFLIFFVAFLQFCYSQNEKIIRGKVMKLYLPFSEVDVVNYSTKKVVKTDEKGEFSIYANVGDIIIIIKKEYIDKKITLMKADFDINKLEINLEKKPIELEDVKIKNSYLPHIYSNQAFSDELRLAKQQAAPKVIGVYTGNIENGMDFNRMGGDFFKLLKKVFKKDSVPFIVSKPIEFKKFVETNIDSDFYTRTLKLEPYEIHLFIEFCEKDINSKEVVINQNTLKVMDFLIFKIVEFRKMRTTKD